MNESIWPGGYYPLCVIVSLRRRPLRVQLPPCALRFAAFTAPVRRRCTGEAERLQCHETLSAAPPVPPPRG
jgi:hypothetical protein